MGKVKRKLLAIMMNTAPGDATPIWSLMGDGITEQTVNYNPQTEEETFVHQDSGDTSITSYRPTIPTPQTAWAGDPVFDFVDKLRKSRAVMSDAETDICMIYEYDTAQAGSYPAEKQHVSVQIDDFGGAGGESLKINYTLNFMGDAVEGQFSPDTNTFTPA